MLRGDSDKAQPLLPVSLQTWDHSKLVLIRCGFKPLSRQNLRTVSLLTPTALAMLRTDHCVTFAGVSCVVLRMISASVLERTVAVRPLRGASCCKTSSPDVTKRFLHVLTVRRVQPRSAAMSLFFRPSPAANTIFARSTSRAGVIRPRDHFVSVSRSSSFKTMGFAIRIVSASLFGI